MGSRKCSEPPAGSSRACKLGFPGHILSIFSSGEGEGRGHQSELGRGREGEQPGGFLRENLVKPWG